MEGRSKSAPIVAACGGYSSIDTCYEIRVTSYKLVQLFLMGEQVESLTEQRFQPVLW